MMSWQKGRGPGNVTDEGNGPDEELGEEAVSHVSRRFPTHSFRPPPSPSNTFSLSSKGVRCTWTPSYLESPLQFDHRQ